MSRRQTNYLKRGDLTQATPKGLIFSHFLEVKKLVLNMGLDIKKDDCQQLLRTLFTMEERERILSEARKNVLGENGRPTTLQPAIEEAFPLTCPNWDFGTTEVLCSTPCVNIPASPFMQKLGFGTGVSVYLMKRSPRGLSRSPWAVKKINPLCNDQYRTVYQKRLTDEAEILKNLSHPNIIGYRAFTEASDGSLCLAMEYGGEKSLNDFIEEQNRDTGKPFPAALILKVALNMARGLKYLHQEKKLLHGDIKSSNVVIKGDFETIKICDVGVSLSLDENMTDSTFDESDFDDEAYYAALGTRPSINMEELDETYQKVIELFSVCTNEEPKDRPSAAQVVEALELDVQ
ncbi:lymphokine-activated killer T-cell-originated protein kinase isoform X2 [Nannospalax galili]|uniref:lymphokine-activated killer T-cell-originated protein kinase isoform X2 n=1 Tax=Nannospalax galili TaxID=1026970 RepID=UPI00111C4D91|nr:lymphokine-activated killer T-cell-originated protein kinase isoform X2 [Nannospalax galili]